MSQSQDEVREACHLLAEHIMRAPAPRNSMVWLKRQMLDMLLKSDNIEALAEEYSQEYPYADIRNSYLVETLKSFDNY